MRCRLPITILFMLSGVCIFAQDPSQQSKQDNAHSFQHVRINQHAELRHSSPMFVVNAGDKSLQFPPAMESRHSFSLDMHDIEPNWIQSITVLKEQEAIEKYGALGKYGVVILDLKDNVFDKMPAYLAEKFQIK